MRRGKGDGATREIAGSGCGGGPCQDRRIPAASLVNVVAVKPEKGQRGHHPQPGGATFIFGVQATFVVYAVVCVAVCAVVYVVGRRRVVRSLSGAPL